MSQEEFAKEIKRHNEELIRALMEEQKNNESKDWSKNPIIYIIVMALLALVLNYANNIFGSDIKILSNDFNNFKQSTENVLENHSRTIKKVEENQKNIETKVEILIDRDKSDFEKAVEKYNKEKSTRGLSVDSLYSHFLVKI